MAILENAKEKFKKIYEDDYCDTDKHFYYKVSTMVPDEVDPENLVLILKLAIQDYEEDTEELTNVLSVIPHPIREVSTPEFYYELWEIYNYEVMGLTQRVPVPEGKYSCPKINEYLIDISNKNKYAVLAGLYNAAVPIGLGYGSYEPMQWDEMTAEIAFEQIGEKLDDESIFFGWVLGRPLRVRFFENSVYVGTYNNNQAPGLAERVISNIPDIKQKEKIIKN